MKFSKKSLYDNKEYLAIRKSLAKEDKLKIAAVEKLCMVPMLSDLRGDYFYLYRKAYEIVYGHFPHFASRKLSQSPLRRLTNYLIHRAGELRGVHFSNSKTA